MGILSVPTLILLLKEGIPLAKKFLTPKTGGKEGSAIAVYLTGQQLFEQYMGCEALDCIQGETVAAFVAALWVFGVTSYTKYQKIKAG